MRSTGSPWRKNAGYSDNRMKTEDSVLVAQSDLGFSDSVHFSKGHLLRRERRRCPLVRRVLRLQAAGHEETLTEVHLMSPEYDVNDIMIQGDGSWQDEMHLIFHWSLITQ